MKPKYTAHFKWVLSKRRLPSFLKALFLRRITSYLVQKRLFQYFTNRLNTWLYVALLAFSTPMVYAADPIAGFGTALDFDGTDDYVQLTNRAIDNSQLANFSLEMWFKTSQTNKGALYEQHMWIRMDPSNNRIRSFLGDSNSNNIAITPAAYNDGQWHHIAVVASGGNLQKIYIDGSKVVEQAGAYNTSPTADVVGIIGRMGQPGGSSYDYFDGKIAEVRIWSTARSQDDIKSTMNLSLKGDETGLIGYWPLNESSGTTATDNKSGGSNNGTLNGPTWTTATIPVEFTILEDSGAFNSKLPASDADGDSLTYSAGTTTATKGSVTINNDGTFTYTPNANENGTDSFSYKVNDGNADSTEVTVTVNLTANNDVPIAGFGTALNFDGTDDYVQLTNRAIDTQLANFSLEMWFKTTQTSSGALYFESVMNAHGIWIRMEPSNNRIRSRLGNSLNNLAITPAAYNDGQWHHIAVIGSGGNLQKVYIDGSKVAEQAGTYDTSQTADVGIIGRMGEPSLGSPYDYFDGKIAEVRIWNTARSQDDIKATMNLSLKGDETGLVGYWPLNDATATTATDKKSGGSNNGTLNGPTWTSATISVEFTILEDSGAFNGKLPASDADGESLTYSAGTTTPTKGSVTINNDGTFTYTPNADENGTDSFSYKVNDGNADSTEVTVTVNITPANDPEIDVQGNSISISDGDNSPSTSDDTDFGSVTVGSNITKTFTIKNTGNAALNLTDSPIVAVTGNGFSITTQPTSPVAATTGETTFVVQFAPSSAGEVTGSISIANDDSDENPYDFAIKGTATAQAAPEIDVQGNSTSISDGDNSPSTSDDTDFGSVTVGSNITKTFTIKNIGNAELTLTDSPIVSVTGNGFSVTTQPTSPVAATTGETTFVVQFAPSSAGEVTGSISIANDDSDENPYDFAIKGTATELTVPEIDVQGNSISISDGDNNPSSSNDTDFGNVIVGSNITKTFTIKNTGNAALNLTDSPIVAVTGNGFSITTQPTSPVAATTGETTFVVQFAPSSAGEVTGSISIANDDSDENPYDFAIKGTATNPNTYITNGQDANGVLGQPDLNSNGLIRVSGDLFRKPRSIAVDPTTGKVFISDKSNRVLRFSTTDAFTNGATAEAVLGQPDFTSDNSATTQSAMNNPKGLFVDQNGRLWVADTNNSRVLRFDNAATKTNGANADGVLGKTDFTSNTTGITQSNMTFPTSITVDNNDTLWVADTMHNRVLRFDNAATKANGANADAVLGQADFTTYIQNTTQNSMSRPSGVTIDNGTLWVADASNNRVLRFDNAATKANGANADGVLGQMNFTTNYHTSSAAYMYNPTGVTLDAAGRLYVLDSNNNRVTIFQNAASKSNGADADFVLGQADFYKDYPNLGGVAANTMNIGYDSSIIFDNSKGSLWVADGNNHRVLRFDLVTPELAPPEMNLKANNITIVDGDTTASISDHTDFGSADITIGTVTRTFTIENTGDTVLSITNTSISGSNSSDFSVTVVPETSVTASESITFTITFDPSAEGLRAATVSIANDDSDENPYDFAIQGTGTAAPEIDVEGKSQNITDFGSVTVGTNITKTFTIKNAGNAELTLTGSPIVSVTGSGFSITTQPTSPVAANGETTFVVQFTPSSAGEVTGSISIANDDSDENPYDFAIKAIGTNPNQAPTISGTPKTQIDAGSDYEFIPTASDPDGDSLTFEIQNKPEWANFDSTTGKLSGQPSSSQTGISANIKISVTDGNTTIFLPAFNILVNAVGGNIKPSAIVATAIVGGANPPSQKVRAYYPFGYNRNYMMSYLQVNANFAYHRYNFLFRDSKWAEWEILFNTKRLGVGVHRGTITIQTGNGNETIPIVVNMLDAAELELSRSKLSFGVVQGGKEPTKQKIRVSSSGSKTLNWSTTVNANWLTVPSQGTTTEDIEIGINTNQLPNAGEHTAIISFRDNESGKTIDVPVTLNVIAANSEEVKLTALEVVQVIQDLNNSIPLIAEKPTFVRAHVSSTTESNVDNVNAKLTGKNGDTVVFEISPSNTGGSINVLTKPNRSNLNDSFLFELPKEFSKGNLSLEFSGVDKPFACEDCTATVSFETIAAIDMKLVDIVWQNKSITPTQEMRQAVPENIYNIYPISTLNVTQNNIPLILNSPNSSELLRTALRNLSSMKYDSSSAIKTQYYYGVAGKFYGTVGISYRPGTLATGAYLEGIDLKMFGNNLKLGKSNSLCGKTVSGSIFSKTISPVTTGADAVYGFNAKTKRIYPPTTSDFMTKRTDSWISDYNYKCAIETLKASTRSARSSRSTRRLVNIITINGRITGTTSGVIDNLVNSVATGSADAPKVGDYKMSLQTNNGTELAAYPFDPVNLNISGDSDASEASESVYSLILPRPDNMKRIVLYDKAGNKLDERIASANAPTVSITAPNGGETIQNDADKLTVTWEANDADGDTLSYAIEYSLDGGTNWQTLVSGYDQKSIEIDVALLAGTKQGKFRVTADDSFNSGSDESDAAFIIEGKNPEVSISSPSNGDLFISGQSINFVGQANDKEDGKLTAASLTWSSDRDGDLGTGESLSKLAEDLAEGTHTITLTATDSQNQTSTSTISINVYRERPTSLPATFSVSEDNFTIGGYVNGGTATADLTINNGGDDSLTWSADSDANWLTLSETSGTAPSNIKLIANPAGLAEDVYSGNVILTSDVPGVIAKTIEVTFRVQEALPIASTPVQQVDNIIDGGTIPKDKIITGATLRGNIINEGTLKDISFEGEELKGGTLAGKLTNKGTFVDVKLSENTEIEGGRLQGNITGAANGYAQLDNLEIVDNSQLSNVSLGNNVTFGKGLTFKDVRFMGASISNAKLEGTIRTASSATVIKDVVLGAKAQIIGGKLAGTIKGDNTDRALLQHLKIEPNSQLSEVIISDGVDIEAGVNLGTGVQFTTADNIPFNVDLTQTLPSFTNSVAVDLSADPVVDGKGLLVSINDLPAFTANKMDQSDKDGNLKLKVEDLTFAVTPVKVKRVDSKDQSVRLGFGNSVYFKTDDGIEVEAHPAVQDLTRLKILLPNLNITKAGNIQVPVTDKLWFSGRAELASKPSKEEIIGFKFKGDLVVLVFEDKDGQKREQVLYPAPASALTEEASLTEEGILSFRTYKGRLDYSVENGEAIKSLKITEIADSNGDFLITYPEGYKQKLFALPAAE